MLEKRISDAKSIKKYYEALEKLQSCQPPLENVLSEQGKRFKKIIKEFNTIWKLWIESQRTQSEAFDQEELGRYLIKIKRSINNRQNSLEFSCNVSRILPCWAVTSLSAKGRLPFKAGFFDLVVFDEASQCDIASALPLLYRAKSAVVIGDSKQLHHISNLKEKENIQLQNKYNVADENWSYSDNSLLGLALSRNFRVKEGLI
ncbi:MAG: AAA domain-containing protein [Candidatus Zeuxoniibacter abyssi]|nr:MAG: AAA domain-containing protein [Candidatus Persebacteraceae bacterium AB1(2)]